MIIVDYLPVLHDLSVLHNCDIFSFGIILYIIYQEGAGAPEISGVFRCTKFNCTGNTRNKIFTAPEAPESSECKQSSI